MDGLLQSPRRLPPTGRGQEDSALAFLLPESLSYKKQFPDLTPCWSEAAEGLTHFYITLILGPAPAPGTKGELKPWAQDHSFLTNLPQHLLCAWRGWDPELRATWSLFSRGTIRQNTAVEMSL